mmetsp:Transcript_26123/g.32658  ORF Transcript_26123/g.32658 Transcript_26123/m.32658 type:complete len:200 (+) Transcript_26123:118-717(+)
MHFHLPISWLKARIISVLTRSALIQIPSMRYWSSRAACLLAAWSCWAFIWALLVPVLFTTAMFWYSDNYLYACFISEMMDIFCSTSCSWVRRVAETSPCFQFSISVFLFMEVMSCCYMAKLLTCYFLSVSTSNLIPFSQSFVFTIEIKSPSIRFSNSLCNCLEPKLVLMRLNGASLFSVEVLSFWSSGLSTISVDVNIS